MICPMRTLERPTDIQTSAPLVAWGVGLVTLAVLVALFTPVLDLPGWLAWVAALGGLAGVALLALGVLHLVQHADRAAGVLKTVKGTY